MLKNTTRDKALVLFVKTSLYDMTGASVFSRALTPFDASFVEANEERWETGIQSSGGTTP